MAATSKRPVKRLSLSRAERRRKEYLDLVQECWPQMTLRDAHDLRPESTVEAVRAESLNVP
jgi:hypothetical protein